MVKTEIAINSIMITKKNDKLFSITTADRTLFQKPFYRFCEEKQIRVTEKGLPVQPLKEIPLHITDHVRAPYTSLAVKELEKSRLVEFSYQDANVTLTLWSQLIHSKDCKRNSLYAKHWNKAHDLRRGKDRSYNFKNYDTKNSDGRSVVVCPHIN